MQKPELLYYRRLPLKSVPTVTLPADEATAADDEATSIVCDEMTSLLVLNHR